MNTSSFRRLGLLSVLLLIAWTTVRAAHRDDITLGYSADQVSPTAQRIGTNDGQQAQVAAAICIPRQKSQHYRGCTIRRIRFAVAAGLQNVQVFIRTSLTSSSVVVQSAPSVVDGWNEVVLNRPYTITGDPFYIGYSATQPADVSAILADGNGTEDTSWLAVDGQWADYHESVGRLYIQAIAEGDLYDFDMALTHFSADKPYYAQGEQPTLHAEFENIGTTAVAFSRVQMYVDDEGPYVMPIYDGLMFSEKMVTLDYKWPTLLGEGSHVATAILETEGDENPRNDTLRTTFYVYASTYPRTMLLEHFTSLNCVNCPPVDHMLEEAVSQRTDVAWVTHRVGYRDDEFTLEASRPLVRFGVAGNPYIMIDRTAIDGSQPAFTIGNYTADFVAQTIFGYAASMPAFVQLAVAAEADGDSLTVVVDGEAKAFIPELYPRSTLHVFIVEDQVQAVGIQAGDTNKRIHDNILRAFATQQRGVLPGWDADARFHYTLSTSLDPSWNVQHLRVIAFVTAPAEAATGYPTGPVLNAAQVRLGQTEAIRQPVATASSAVWHTLDGRAVSAPVQRGVYIADGKKRIVR